MNWRLPIIAALSFLSSAQATEFKLCVDSNDWMPYTYAGRDGTLQILARRVAATLHHTVRFTALPWRRCQIEVEKGELDGLIGLPTDIYSQNSFVFPRKDGAIDESRAVAVATLVLVKKAGSGVEWDGRTLKGYNGPVSYVLGYTEMAERLAALGIPGDPTVRTTEQNVRRLLAGRADVFAAYSQDAQSFTEMPDYKGKIEIFDRPLSVDKFYIGFGKNFYARNKDVVERFWAQCVETKNSPDYQDAIKDMIK